MASRTHALHGTLVLAAAFPVAGFMAPLFRDAGFPWLSAAAEAAVSDVNRSRESTASFIVPTHDSWAVSDPQSELTAEPADDVAVEPSADAAAEPTVPAQPSRHTVRGGETLESIANKLDVSLAALVAANGLGNPDYVQAGHVLLVPGASGGQPQAVRFARVPEETFILELAPGAQQSQRTTGAPASVTIAQGILESDWGSSYLAREANNLFGVKAQTKAGPAGVIVIDAWEVENGQNVVRSGEPFRKYESKSQSVADHGLFFIENGRYHHALLAKDDPREFARRINEAGYATDPAYAAKLISLMDRYDLYRFDAQ